MKTICIIPARAGSKRCPNKNTKPFSDKSLTILAVEQAIRLKFHFSEIVFTSNDPVAIEQAKSCGDKIIIRRRPKDLCEPESSSESAIEDAMEFVGGEFDMVMLLEVTSPLRIDDDILHSLKLAGEYGKGVKSVCEIKNCLSGPIIEPKYQLNGAIHLWRSDYIRDTPYDRFSFHHMDASRSIHIDYPWEFDVAEMLYKKFNNME